MSLREWVRGIRKQGATASPKCGCCEHSGMDFFSDTLFCSHPQIVQVLNSGEYALPPWCVEARAGRCGSKAKYFEQSEKSWKQEATGGIA